MKAIIVFFLIFVVTQNCNAEGNEMKPVIENILGVPVRDFSTQDFGRDKFEGAMSIIIPEQGHKNYLLKVRDKLPTGFIAFIGTTTNSVDAEIQEVEMVVIETNDQIDILKVAQTHGLNYDITNDMIIEKLRSWDEKYGIDIWHAESDTIQLKFDSLPKDPESFALEVYEFCPDLVDFGSDDVSEIRDYLVGAKAMFLWWD